MSEHVSNIALQEPVNLPDSRVWVVSTRTFRVTA